MFNVLLISRSEKKKSFLSQVLGAEYYILVCDNEKKIDVFLLLADVVIVDLSSLEWETLNVVAKVKEHDDSAVILGIGREAKSEIVEAAKKRGLTRYLDVEKDLGALREVIEEQMESKMLISKIEDEEFARQLSTSPSSLQKEPTFSLNEWRFLEEMSHFFTHGYDMDELMQFFLGLVSRTFGIPRLCFVLEDRMRKTYRIRACLGMTKEAKEYVQLNPQHGLVKFFCKEGTAVIKDRILGADFRTAYEIKKDMKLIQSEVAVPLAPQGELIGILGLGLKITGEKMSPKEIKQVFLLCNQVGLAIQNLLFYEKMCAQKGYIENILKDATSCIISVDRGEKISTCNPRAREVLELDPDMDLTGKNIRTLPSPLGDLLFATLTQGTMYARKEVYVPAIKRWLGINTSRIKDVKGEISGSVMIFTDLSPVKRLQEEEKRAQKKGLLAQVAVRLSHELRNSMVPIKSLAEFLTPKYSHEGLPREMFSVVTKEIERIDNLIESLVFFSQPLHLDRTAQLLPELITESMENTKKKKTPGNKQIHFSVNYSEEGLQLYVDKTRTIDALTHIFTNSVEAIVEDTPEIVVNCDTTDSLPESISVRVQERADFQRSPEYVKIEIKDNGLGFSEIGDKNIIFDPFFTTKNRGIGLGLTIARTIIEEHGGGIVPISERGKGATIEIYLPRYRPDF